MGREDKGSKVKGNYFRLDVPKGKPLRVLNLNREYLSKFFSSKPQKGNRLIFLFHLRIESGAFFGFIKNNGDIINLK